MFCREISCRRATSETLDPGAAASATIRIFSSKDQRRRRSLPFSTSTRISHLVVDVHNDVVNDVSYLDTEVLVRRPGSAGYEKYAAIGKAWRRAWQEVIPFFAFPREVRRILYTTNAIEALNSKLRRAVRARGHFPNDEAALKLLFLVLNRAEKDWKMPPREWTAAKAQMAVIFGDRFAKAMTA